MRTASCPLKTGNEAAYAPGKHESNSHRSSEFHFHPVANSVRRRLHLNPRHSDRSTIMGSILVARRAGSQLARSAVPANSSETPAITIGSRGDIP